MADETAAPAAAAPEAGAQTQTAVPAESLSVDPRDTYFAMMNTLDEAEASEGSEEASGEDQEGEPSETEVGAETPEKPEKEAGEKAKADADAEPEKELPPPEEDPEDLKKRFKDRPDLRTAYYRDKAFKETGMTVETARTFKELNVTKDTAIKVRQVFATDADIDRTVELASSMQALYDDYLENPVSLLRNLEGADKRAFAALTQVVADHLPKINPQAHSARVSKDLWNVMNAARDRAEAADDIETLAAAEHLIAKMFPGAKAQEKQQAKPELPPGYQEELDRLRAMERQQEERQRAASQQRQQEFGTRLHEEAAEGVRARIKEIILEAKPTGFDEETIKRMVDTAYKAVDKEFINTPTIMSDLKRLVQAGDYSEAHRKAVVQYILDRTKVASQRHAASEISFWAKRTFPQQQQKQEKQTAVAAKKDVGKPGSASPKPAPAAFVAKPGIPYEKQMADFLAQTAKER